jgi:hypothetical protein
MSTQLCEGLVGVDELAGFHLLDALSDRVVEPCSFFRVELVVVHEIQLDLGTFGQVRGLVQNETAVLHVGLERLHDHGSLAAVAIDGYAAVIVVALGMGW